jgi:hypothetical protein
MLSYNFVKLNRHQRTTTNEADVVYTATHLRDGKVAALVGGMTWAEPSMIL